MLLYCIECDIEENRENVDKKMLTLKNIFGMEVMLTCYHINVSPGYVHNLLRFPRTRC